MRYLYKTTHHFHRIVSKAHAAVHTLYRFPFQTELFSFDYLLAQLTKKMLLCSNDMWMDLAACNHTKKSLIEVVFNRKIR